MPPRRAPGCPGRRGPSWLARASASETSATLPVRVRGGDPSAPVTPHRRDHPPLSSRCSSPATDGWQPGVINGATNSDQWPPVATHARQPIPERGLYTGVAILGAVGSGKTLACMRSLAQQILSRQAANPQRRERRAGLPQLPERRRNNPRSDAVRGSVPRGVLVSSPDESSPARAVPEGSQRDRGATGPRGVRGDPRRSPHLLS